jgi:hypothetical protein
MNPIRFTTVATLTAAALAATGCGQLTNPYDKPTPAAASNTAPAPSASPAPAAAAAPAPSASSADQAIRRFATTFINWDFDHLATIRQRLVSQSAGPLAQQMGKAVDQALIENSRRVSNQGNEGTVKVIANPKHDGHYFIVTHETAKLGDTRAQSAYMVYTATATKIGDTYKLTSFAAVS